MEETPGNSGQKKFRVPPLLWGIALLACFIAPPLGITALIVLGALYAFFAFYEGGGKQTVDRVLHLDDETIRREQMAGYMDKVGKAVTTVGEKIRDSGQALRDSNQNKPVAPPLIRREPPPTTTPVKSTSAPGFEAEDSVLSIEEGIPLFLQAGIREVVITISFAVCANGEGNYMQVRYARFLAFPSASGSKPKGALADKVADRMIFGKKVDLHLQNAYFTDGMPVQRAPQTEYLDLKQAPLSELISFPKTSAFKACLIFLDLLEALGNAGIKPIIVSNHALEKLTWVEVTTGVYLSRALSEQREIIWSKDRADVSAHPDIALTYAVAYFKEGRPDLALHFLRETGDHSSPEAQMLYGCCLLHSETSPEEIQVALRWLSVSARRGNSDAQRRLGIAFLEGRIVPPSEAQGLRWLRLAATNIVRPHPAAMSDLAEVLMKDGPSAPTFEEGLSWKRRAAELGYSNAG